MKLNLRKLAIWAIVIGFSLPLCAEPQPGAISGYVRNVSGTPQMGAVVQILGAAHQTFTVFTDAAGYYTASGLVPGLYSLKVTAPSFLPALREKVGLRPGDRLNINVTLSTLLGIMELGPVRSLPDDDDWKWTLRSVANRPVLRVFDDPNMGTLSDSQDDDEITGSLSFLGGSAAEGYGSGSDMSTAFSLQRNIFSVDRVGVKGNVAYGDGLPAAILRANYSHVLPDGSGPSMGVAVRRFAPSDPNIHNASLQSVAISAADDVTMGDALELKFGSELQSIQFLGRVTAFRPYGNADLHITPHTIVGYSYATALPSHQDDNFDAATSADAGETDPRISLANFSTKLEREHHQELNVSQRLGRTNLQFALFSDRLDDTALLGTGTVTAAAGNLLPDAYSGTFT